MKKALPIIVAILVVAIGTSIYFANKKTNNSSSPSTNSSHTTMPQQSTNNSGSSKTTTPQTADKVSIVNFAFSPASINIKKGTAVTWTNNDNTIHTVTEADSQKGPMSSDLNQGQSYTFTFDAPGTYHYKCSIHPNMMGTITVT